MKEKNDRIILVPKEGYYIPERVIRIYRYQYGFYALGLLIVFLGVYLHRMWIADTILRYVANAIVLIGISIMLYTYAIVYKVDKAAEKMRERELY